MKVTDHGSGYPGGDARVPTGRGLGNRSLPVGLPEILTRRKDAVVEAWLAQALQGYSENAARFFLQEKDPFRNPVGHAFKQGLQALFDQLFGEMDRAALTAALDDIVRIRAIQDFTPSQAVAFIFQLKGVVREVLQQDMQVRPPGFDLESLDNRIDEMALAAFDLYLQYRERLLGVRIHEMKRRMFLLERMHPAFAEFAGPGQTDEEPQRDHCQGGR